MSPRQMIRSQFLLLDGPEDPGEGLEIAVDITDDGRSHWLLPKG